MSEDARIEEMIAAACLGKESAAELTADPRAFLVRYGLDQSDVESILAAAPRLGLYRRLIRNNLTGVTEKLLRRTRARLNAAAQGAFDESFASFLDEVGPRTHYLRDVPAEFMSWVTPHWRARADLPAWLLDFAHHEIVEFQVGAAEPALELPEVAEPSFNRPLVFIEAVRLMRYSFAVHELPLDEADRSTPVARPTALLVYRDEQHAVENLELSAFHAAVVEGLLAGTPLAKAVQNVATESQRASELAGVARLLAELGERGIVLGGEPAK